MLEIASTLTKLEYKYIKMCDTTKLMSDTLATIYGGDTNVLRDKAKSLRGKFDDMKMLENKTIVNTMEELRML